MRIGKILFGLVVGLSVMDAECILQFAKVQSRRDGRALCERVLPDEILAHRRE
jgi:hypothetical protein